MQTTTRTRIFLATFGTAFALTAGGAFAVVMVALGPDAAAPVAPSVTQTVPPVVEAAPVQSVPVVATPTKARKDRAVSTPEQPSNPTGWTVPAEDDDTTAEVPDSRGAVIVQPAPVAPATAEEPAPAAPVAEEPETPAPTPTPAVDTFTPPSTATLGTSPSAPPMSK